MSEKDVIMRSEYELSKKMKKLREEIDLKEQLHFIKVNSFFTSRQG